jgi:hypothetical protein
MRINKLRDDQPMAVLGVPDVRVLKLVHVDVEAVGVHVHVGNENTRLTIFSHCLLECSGKLYFIWSVKSSPVYRANWLFPLPINIFALLQDLSGKTLENIFRAASIRSRNREFTKATLLLYKKIPRIPSVKESEGSRVQGSKFKRNREQDQANCGTTNRWRDPACQTNECSNRPTST